MKMIPTKAHGILDYAVGVVLIAAPWIFGFANLTAAGTWVPVILGASTIVYSLCTNYELGAIRVIPMPTHLFLDLLAGILLAASPWLFGFASIVFLPHLVFGLLEIGAAALTSRHPAHSRPYVPE